MAINFDELGTERTREKWGRGGQKASIIMRIIMRQ
jgi:hypothetical protein